MTLVDSSGWIQHLTDGPLADAYEKHLSAEDLLVPTIVIYQVCKFIQRAESDDAVGPVAARLQEGEIAPLDERIALSAAALSLEHGVAMAAAIVYAAARSAEATLVACDADFRDRDAYCDRAARSTML